MENKNLILILVGVLSIVLVANFLINTSLLTKLTGRATTDTGSANLTIESQTNINFTTDAVNWGSGRVTAGQTRATLNSEGYIANGNWSNVSSGLILENIGNVNVTLELQAGSDAATFIGGTAPTYQWKVNNSEANSCTGGQEGLGTYRTVNSSQAGIFCSNFSYLTSSNSIEIDVNITIPEDSAKGARASVITATATAA